jgi:stage II sporulation protein AA (anti-sigma F factor antagonist)
MSREVAGVKLEFSSARDVLLVRVKGEMDMATAERMRQSIDDRLQQDKTQYLLLNLTGVSFIDSSGVGVILGRYRYLNRIGGKMAIVNPQLTVKRVLETAGIPKLIPIVVNEGEGLKQLTNFK